MIKRIFICLSIIIIIVFILLFFIYKKNNINNNSENIILEEYTPEEEISDKQVRQTMLYLYFKDDQGLVQEIRLIDVKDLINDPYNKILNLLIKGPKNENLQKTIPENTKINKIEKIGDILIIDFSKEFIENHKGGEKEEKNTINSIVNTLTELKEINGIKIKINGEENKEFKDGIIKFNKIFIREK